MSFIGDKDGGMSRLRNWHFPLRSRRLSIPMSRRPPGKLTPYYGAAEMVIARPLARWLFKEVRRRPELVSFFRRTWAPDELFVQSLAMSSPMSDDISPANLWFTDWDPGAAHPKVLERQDFTRLEAAALGRAEPGPLGGSTVPGGEVKLFARKFDALQDDVVLDLIDRELRGRPTTNV